MRFSSDLRTLVFLLSVGLLVALTGCSAAPAGPQIECHDAWGRPSPKKAGAGAVYVVIENKGRETDRLIGATSPAAKTVELHESFMDDDVMKMRPVAGLDIPAGGMVELKPGSYHIMLIDLAEAVQVGSTIPVTLLFEKSGEITLDVEIQQ